MPDKVYMLTTTDNPFNPFTHYVEWDAYDKSLGHHSASLLARIANTSFALSEADQQAELNNAIDRIVSLNPNGLYKKVSRDSF